MDLCERVRSKGQSIPALGKSRIDGQTRRLIARALLLVITMLTVAGCAARIWNQPIEKLDPSDAYVFRSRLPVNADDTFIVLAFSGGGTRSAAFAYGVLEKFRDTEIMIDGQQRRLLDEVDVITSVSGGSFTAAYYGLFGDRIFTDFEARFLRRDTQAELYSQLLNPLNLTKLAAGDFNRSDLAAQWFDRELFEHKTFADISRNNLPFVIINASDLNNGTTFSFIQQQFDFLCSSLTGYPVANSVAASSAVPVAFATISLRNYEDCTQRHGTWVDQALAEDSPLDRRYGVARALERYSRPDRMPVVRLVDGGVTDNLGVRGSMMSPVAQYGNVPDMAGAFTAQQLASVRNVLVVVANAQVYDEYPWSRDGSEPGIFASGSAAFDAALGILNTETASLAKQGFEMWEQRINALRGDDTPPVSVYFSVLTFNQISDLGERDYFDALPTALKLESQAVDSVRGLAGRLLDESPEFTKFVKALQ